MADEEHYLVEPYEIDDGSLEGLDPKLIFSMGVEWHIWMCRILSHSPKTDLCLAPNAHRIVRMLERHGYFCEDRVFPFPLDDGSINMQYRQIWVGDLIKK